MRLIFSLIFISSIISGCDNYKNVDRTKVREEMSRRKLKKVSEVEIISEANRLGRIIATEAQEYLERKTAQFLDNQNSTLRIEDFKKIHQMDSLEKLYEAEINYLGLLTSKINQPESTIEADILEAYQYNLEKNIQLSDNIQKVDENYLLYNKPIVLQNSCLKCHGIPEEQVSVEYFSSVQANYPNERITGFSKGDVIGIWSIKLSQKKIVQDL